jgi:hypothetical protein
MPIVAYPLKEGPHPHFPLNVAEAGIFISSEKNAALRLTARYVGA